MKELAPTGIWDNPQPEEMDAYNEFLVAYLSSDDKFKQSFEESQDEGGDDVVLRALAYSCTTEPPVNPYENHTFGGCNPSVYRISAIGGTPSPDITGDYTFMYTSTIDLADGSRMSINQYSLTKGPTTYYTVVGSGYGVCQGIMITTSPTNCFTSYISGACFYHSTYWGYRSGGDPPDCDLGGLNGWSGTVRAEIINYSGGEWGTSGVFTCADAANVKGWASFIVRIDPICVYPNDSGTGVESTLFPAPPQFGVTPPPVT